MSDKATEGMRFLAKLWRTAPTLLLTQAFLASFDPEGPLHGHFIQTTDSAFVCTFLRTSQFDYMIYSHDVNGVHLLCHKSCTLSSKDVRNVSHLIGG